MRNNIKRTIKTALLIVFVSIQLLSVSCDKHDSVVARRTHCKYKVTLKSSKFFGTEGYGYCDSYKIDGKEVKMYLKNGTQVAHFVMTDDQTVTVDINEFAERTDR